MLTYMRNKLISVSKQDSDTMNVHGILDDDMYAIELHVSLKMANLEISSIDGKWNRWTTPECHRAIPTLQGAVGMSMEDEDFTQKVNKIISRSSCRHFANLLLECCHSAREAARRSGVVQQDSSAPEVPDSGPSGIESPRTVLKFQEEYVPEKETKVDPGKGMIIDLHVHTSPASPCSSAPVDALIQEAKRIGLDGICLTDHNHLWPPHMIEDLRQRHGFLVLAGNEVTTNQGDMLVFGLKRNIKGIITIEALREEVERTEGFIIAAHPFRGFLVVGMGQIGLTPQAAMERPLFKHVNAIEALNSRVTVKENDFAREVASGLGLPVTGGSDAHEVKEVGIYGTRFSSGIGNERELIQALKQGEYEPVVFRNEAGLQERLYR
jgi:predicted metal-dependent phosphoesterase TrpH